MPIFHNAFAPALPQVQIPVYGKQRVVPTLLKGRRRLGQDDGGYSDYFDSGYGAGGGDFVDPSAGIDFLPQTPDLPGSALFTDPSASGFDISQLTDLNVDPVTQGIMEGSLALPSGSGISQDQLLQFIDAGGNEQMLADVLTSNDPSGTMLANLELLGVGPGDAYAAAAAAAAAKGKATSLGPLPAMGPNPGALKPIPPGTPKPTACPTGYVADPLYQLGLSTTPCKPASATTSTQVPAPSPTVSTLAPAGSLSSWFTGSTLVSGIPNAVILIGGAALLAMLAGGKRR